MVTSPTSISPLLPEEFYEQKPFTNKAVSEVHIQKVGAAVQLPYNKHMFNFFVIELSVDLWFELVLSQMAIGKEEQLMRLWWYCSRAYFQCHISAAH